ncbi:MAG: AzlC family ABC transporter permease [Comamonadaceae bacterium]|nr:AzlC family ABC transporter permease [Comamonadaceae bacterium]
MQNTKTEIRDAFWDTAPFLFSVFFTFLVIGALARQKNLGGLEAIFFTASMMSEPLQLTLLNAPLDGLTWLGIIASALSANLRFVVFTLAIKENLQGPIRRFIPALMVMANAAYMRMSMRQSTQKVTAPYANAVCFSLYAAALLGTFLGYISGSLLGDALNQHASAALAIFLCAQIGKMCRDKKMLYTAAAVLLLCMGQIFLFSANHLLITLVCAIAITHLYDRR